VKVQSYTSKGTVAHEEGRAAASAATRRDVILDAAERLFATHGYYGASVRAIAREAGITPSLLQKYYPTKEDILAAFVDEATNDIDNFVTAVHKIVNNTADTPLLLRRIAYRYMALIHRRRGFYLTWITSPDLVRSFSPALPEFISLEQATLARILAQRSGCISEDAALLRVRIFFAALFSWVMYYCRVGILKSTTSESTELRVARLVDSILSPQEAAGQAAVGRAP
jgi:AcrR family transcriptional regulator